ncbi:MAG: hypothetical protein UT03_C0033G0001, partial [Candidatus Moranbacteria bacterium GW2011_GWD2_38_7]
MKSSSNKASLSLMAVMLMGGLAFSNMGASAKNGNDDLRGKSSSSEQGQFSTSTDNRKGADKPEDDSSGVDRRRGA